MIRAALATVAVVSPLLSAVPGAAAPLTSLTSPKVEVPTSDATFPPGPGSEEINNNCLACHSADHVLNQPSLTREKWDEVVRKMIVAYKAPITDEDAAKIIEYLATMKGTP